MYQTRDILLVSNASDEKGFFELDSDFYETVLLNSVGQIYSGIRVFIQYLKIVTLTANCAN